MTGGVFNQPATVSLQRRLSLLSAERGAIADNLANASTPGYRPIRAQMGGGLTLAGGGSFAQTLSSVASIRYVPASDGPMRLDGNGVDVDVEMARLARTQLWYAAGARALQLDFQRLRTAVTGQ